MSGDADSNAARGNDSARILAVLDRFHPRARRRLVGIGVLSFLAGLSEAAILVLVTGVAVAVNEGRDDVGLAGVSLSTTLVLVLAGVLLLLGILLTYLLARAIAGVSASASLRARQELLRAFHAASYERKSRDRVASLQEALTTYVDRFTQAFAALATLLAAVLSLSSFAVAALVVNPLTAVALSVVGALLVLILRPATMRTRAAAQRLTHQRRDYAEGATESVLLSRELAVFGVAGEAGERLRRRDAEVADQFYTSRFLAAFTPRLYQGLALALVIVGLLVLTSIEVDDLAAIGAVVLLLVRSLSYGQQVLTGLQQQAEMRPYVDRLVELLDSYSDAPRHQGTTAVGEIRSIELRQVGFGYEGASGSALRDLSLVVGAGETIGVVGPSGAGKSTLVNVLLRLYEPTAGEVTVNGVPLREVDDEEWHRRTAIVPQEPRLVHGSIADNIRFLRDLDDDDVARAAREARVEEFVADLPLGLDSPVGELGGRLSGGQRQRICIARALAGRPDLLVLDEPTSALDGESEAAIGQTLAALKGRVTMVIVAHRLSTLTICDRLVILQEGTLASIGTAAELQSRSAYYREVSRLAGL
ncbi:ABC transporter ATP-binding protein [Iamia majanohamensis]|uniref:ABC transporter ATP-binding protein n=1 Tax=Iamia majanohamensis TaxID=467976 RepID=A0AAE9YDJ7_9ACTN|nr:ABC transporter ATP-binding protein [Iamia majanohamensis]WCO65846.1 ABC transporter ATP-binding protein [Iamia majanohamensis]